MDADPLGVVGTYDELLAICRAQVQRLDLNYDALDLAAGFTVGYATKLFSHSAHYARGGRRTKRFLSGESFDAYLAALGLKLAVIEDAERIAKVKAFCAGKLLQREGPKRASGPREIIPLTHAFMRKIGRKGGIASGRTRAATARMREINRANALKRWAKADFKGQSPRY